MPDIKTSFIPKQPSRGKMSEIKKSHPMSTLTFISMIIFFLALAAAGGVYVYQIILEQEVKDKTADIERTREAINPALVETLTKMSNRLTAVRGLLEGHVATSPIFDILEKSTLQAVRYKKFDYAQKGNEHSITLSGEARNYNALAFQADVFGDDPAISNPIFSNLSLNQDGNVNFTLSASVKRDFVLYRALLGSAGQMASFPGSVGSLIPDINGLDTGGER